MQRMMNKLATLSLDKCSAFLFCTGVGWTGFCSKMDKWTKQKGGWETAALPGFACIYLSALPISVPVSIFWYLNQEQSKIECTPFNVDELGLKRN
jgi:hypothetical protein